MKRDPEVLCMLRERAKGRTQEQAAARAGMSVRTAGTYERRGQLPSQLTQPRRYRTRPNPFAADWPWITGQLERDAALQATTLFALLCDQHPGRYQAVQLRTLQRQIATWRAQYGPGQRGHLPPDPPAGRRRAVRLHAHGRRLAVTLGGVPFPHLLFHLVLSYSNVEAIQVCFSESFESLVEGIERCLWQLGGVPQRHRTDHLSAAIHPLDGDGRALAKDRYSALMRALRDGADHQHAGRGARERRRRASAPPLQGGGGPGAARAGQSGVSRTGRATPASCRRSSRSAT